MDLKTMTQNDLLKMKLIDRFLKAREQKEKLTKELEDAEKEFDDSTMEVIEMFDAGNTTTSGKIPGVGQVIAVKPQVYARVMDEEVLFAKLREMERDDLIKETVNAGSLSTFVKELIEDRKNAPDGAYYEFKRRLRYIPEKKS